MDERVDVAFVKLFNAGCPLFHTWSARISGTERYSITINDSKGINFSNEAPVQQELKNLCLCLEDIKDKWEDYVFKTRKRHRLLNYNIQQMAKLCRDLGLVRSRNDEISRDDLHLLTVLNEDVTSDTVVDLVRNLGTLNQRGAVKCAVCRAVSNVNLDDLTPLYFSIESLLDTNGILYTSETGSYEIAKFDLASHESETVVTENQ